MKIYPHQIFANADGENLPFKDKEFDYVICNQVLEHVENPEKFISEQCRVASRGYMETPSLLGEFLFPKKSHRWIILDIDNKLVLFEKSKMPDHYENNYGELFLNYLPYQSWILEAINLRPIERDENEDFVEFFGHFATDSLFQSQRVREPLAFVTTDPDDDFSVLETTLDLNQWFAFKPALPAERLSNINYGQRNDDGSPTKILALKGIGNGFSNILYFRRKAGEWELYKFEDVSI